MLNPALKVPWETCQQFLFSDVNSLLRMLWKSVIFLDFQLSQGSVETHCRWGGNLGDIQVYIENFRANQLVVLSVTSRANVNLYQNAIKLVCTTYSYFQSCVDERNFLSVVYKHRPHSRHVTIYRARQKYNEHCAICDFYGRL